MVRRAEGGESGGSRTVELCGRHTFPPQVLGLSCAWGGSGDGSGIPTPPETGRGGT